MASFGVPALFLIHGLLSLGGVGTGWIAELGGMIEIIFAILAAILVGAALFTLRSHDVFWWHGLLLSVGSVCVMVGILLLIGSLQVVPVTNSTATSIITNVVINQS